MRRQNVDNQDIERKRLASIAADKSAADKLEAEQKRIWQQEAEQLKKDKDRLDAQKWEEDKRSEKRRKEEIERLEKQRLADAEKQRLQYVEKARIEREKAAQVVEKTRIEKEKTAQVVDNQEDTLPSFSKRYKIFLIVVAVLSLVLVWAIWPKNPSQVEPKVENNTFVPTPLSRDVEANDFQKATTIPEVNAYLQRYPSLQSQIVAIDKLNKLKSALNTHLNNVRSQIKDFPDAAKEDLEKARAIDPTNADVIKWTKQLKLPPQ